MAARPRIPLRPLGALLIAGSIGGPPQQVRADPEACGADATPIHAIQGAGRSSPLLGRDVVVDAVVVASFPGLPEGLGGFFLQEEDGDGDGDPHTSEGLFVFDGDERWNVAAGDRVRVSGRVGEFFGLTELSAVRELIPCPRRGPARAVPVRLPVSDVADWERWEGMRVRIEQPLVVTGHHGLASFGELELASGPRLWQPTHHFAPGGEARRVQEQDARRRILLDDGSDAFEPAGTPYLDRADGSTLRLGDGMRGLEGVLEFAFGRFRIHPVRRVRLEAGARRPAWPPEVGGTLRVIAWNVDNHFNGDGRGGGFPTRGPRSEAELERQRAKLVATLVRLDPDVAVLVELENDGPGPDGSLAQLVDALNGAVAGAPYAALDPGVPRLGSQAIAVGLLYRPDRVRPLGDGAILDTRVDPDFDDRRNRPSLAQSFATRDTHERLTVVAAHLKSKGSTCDAAGDPDLGDGQGDCNAVRTRAARALVAWLAGDPTGVGAAPVLVAGDLNAYPREDPVQTFLAGGYTDLIAAFAGPDAHSFVFDGAAGRLDHLLARRDLLPFVAGAGVWHTNADEPRALDYRQRDTSDRYAPDPFRASDHDPVLVGLFPDADADGLTDVRDHCPHSAPEPTLIVGECDTGIPERSDEAGCTLRDHLDRLRAAHGRRGTFVAAALRWLEASPAAGEIRGRARGRLLRCLARWQAER